jgi:hypothetical protein
MSTSCPWWNNARFCSQQYRSSDLDRPPYMGKWDMSLHGPRQDRDNGHTVSIIAADVYGSCKCHGGLHRTLGDIPYFRAAFVLRRFQWFTELLPCIYETRSVVQEKNKTTREAMHVQRNIEERSRNHCCRETAVLHILSVCNLSYPACNSHASYYIVICVVLGCTVYFSHYLTNGKIFGKKLLNMKCVCFTFLYNLHMQHFSF